MDAATGTQPQSASLSLAGRILGYLDWKINPVLLRDLRIYTRGKLLTVSFFIILSALTLTAVGYTLVSSLDGSSGQGLLSNLMFTLVIICGALVPNLVFERFRSELNNKATELSLMSPLTPAKLVRGKLLGAWCMSLIVISMASPMLITAYMLGGVNIIMILGIVVCVMLAGGVMPCVQLFLTANKGGKSVGRIAASLVFVGQIFTMIGYGTFLYFLFFESAGDEIVGWAVLCCMGLAGILVAQFLYFSTVSRLRGELENRDAAPRASLVAAAAAGGISAYAVSKITAANAYGSPRGISDFFIISLVAIFVSYAFCLGFIILSHTRPAVPQNLREKWRKKYIRRAFLLPGIKSLTAYFVLCAAVILISSLIGPALSVGSELGLFESVFDVAKAYDGHDTMFRLACLSMAPIMAILIGIPAYYYLVLPFVKERQNPRLLPLTIVVSNIFVGIVSAFGLMLASIAIPDKELHFLKGLTPLGLWTTIYSRYDDDVGSACIAGFVVIVILALSLVPILFGKNRRLTAGDPWSENAPR